MARWITVGTIVTILLGLLFVQLGLCDHIPGLPTVPFAELQLQGQGQDQHYLLTPRQHEGMALTKAAIPSFWQDPENMLPVQKSALTELKTLISDWSSESMNPTEVPSETFMKSMIVAIGQVFFLAPLEMVDFAWDHDACKETRARGQFWHSWEDDGIGHEYEIVMDPHRYDSDITLGMLGTLLHECVHAFRDVWMSEQNCPNDYCSTDGSHDALFYILASHVEAAARQHLDMRVSLSHRGALIGDFDKLGVYPSEEVRQLCHPSWQGEILEFLQSPGIRAARAGNSTLSRELGRASLENYLLLRSFGVENAEGLDFRSFAGWSASMLGLRDAVEKEAEESASLKPALKKEMAAGYEGRRP